MEFVYPLAGKRKIDVVITAYYYVEDGRLLQRRSGKRAWNIVRLGQQDRVSSRALYAGARAIRLEQGCSSLSPASDLIGMGHPENSGRSMS